MCGNSRSAPPRSCARKIRSIVTDTLLAAQRTKLTGAERTARERRRRGVRVEREVRRHCRIARNSKGLFEHCVGALQERSRDREANGFRSLEIDGQLELRGLLYGHIFRKLALQDLLHKLGAVPNGGGPIRSE